MMMQTLLVGRAHMQRFRRTLGGARPGRNPREGDVTGRRLVFVTGAACSGKSQHAENLASFLAGGEPVLYVATDEAGDKEMQWRVEEHGVRIVMEPKTTIFINLNN